MRLGVRWLMGNFTCCRTWVQGNLCLCRVMHHHPSMMQLGLHLPGMQQVVPATERRGQCSLARLLRRTFPAVELLPQHVAEIRRELGEWGLQRPDWMVMLSHRQGLATTRQVPTPLFGSGRCHVLLAVSTFSPPVMSLGAPTQAACRRAALSEPMRPLHETRLAVLRSTCTADSTQLWQS